MSTMRLRRLQADYDQLRDYVNRHPRVQLIQAEGDPPERYQLEYHINSLRQRDSELEEVRSHLVEISLTRNYPRTPPQCRMLTPVFHPNIAPHAICIGDHWSAGEPLPLILARIGELLAYQSYNIKSPLNGEAARWVDQNLARLPLDSVSMMVEEKPPVNEPAPSAASVPLPPISAAPSSPVPPQPATFSPAPSSTAPPNPAPMSETPLRPILVDEPDVPPTPRAAISCPSCQAQIRLPPGMAGKRGRCPRCNTVLVIPP